MLNIFSYMSTKKSQRKLVELHKSILEGMKELNRLHHDYQYEMSHVNPSMYSYDNGYFRDPPITGYRNSSALLTDITATEQSIIETEYAIKKSQQELADLKADRAAKLQSTTSPIVRMNLNALDKLSERLDTAEKKFLDKSNYSDDVKTLGAMDLIRSLHEKYRTIHDQQYRIDLAAAYSSSSERTVEEDANMGLFGCVTRHIEMINDLRCPNESELAKLLTDLETQARALYLLIRHNTPTIEKYLKHYGHDKFEDAENNWLTERAFGQLSNCSITLANYNDPDLKVKDDNIFDEITLVVSSDKSSGKEIFTMQAYPKKSIDTHLAYLTVNNKTIADPLTRGNIVAMTTFSRAELMEKLKASTPENHRAAP